MLLRVLWQLWNLVQVLLLLGLVECVVWWAYFLPGPSPLQLAHGDCSSVAHRRHLAANWVMVGDELMLPKLILQ